jgi:hypothetical protein
MNKKGNGMNGAFKILLLIAGLIAVFTGINSLIIASGAQSLVRILSSSVLMMQIIYVLMGIGTLVTAVFVGIKIFKK